MEPVAHYGIRKGEKNISIKVVWTDGQNVDSATSTAAPPAFQPKAETNEPDLPF